MKIDERPFRQSKTGLSIFIRLTPNSSKDEIFGVEYGATGSYFKARVRARPEKGKANTALIKLIAKWLNIPKSRVTLKSGSKSRIKIVEISNADENTIELLDNNLASLHQRSQHLEAHRTKHVGRNNN